MKTALELAILALAPVALVERLAAPAGLLEALTELPPDAPPVTAVAPRTVERARHALEEWRDWQAKHAPTGAA